MNFFNKENKVREMESKQCMNNSSIKITNDLDEAVANEFYLNLNGNYSKNNIEHARDITFDELMKDDDFLNCFNLDNYCHDSIKRMIVEVVQDHIFEDMNKMEFV